MKVNPCLGPPPTVHKPTCTRVTEIRHILRKTSACTRDWTRCCVPEPNAIVHQSYASKTVTMQECSWESYSSRPSTGHNAGTCEQGGERGPPGAHFHLGHDLAIKSLCSSLRHRCRVKEARICALWYHLCASNNRQNQSEGRGPWAWGRGLEGPETLHDGGRPPRPGWQLHHSLLSEAGGVTDSKHLNYISGCSCLLSRKTKISFLGNEVPSAKMSKQMVSNPPKLFSQPSKTVSMRYVSWLMGFLLKWTEEN